MGRRFESCRKRFKNEFFTEQIPLNYKINFLNYSDNKGLIFFNFGILFLPSALPVGGLFLIIALLISIIKNRTKFLNDKFNYVFIFSSILLVINCIYNSLKILNGEYNRLYNIPPEIKFNISTIYLDLFNWIPLFICFWGFQFYLNSVSKRKIFAKFLLIGTVPVIFSCFAQFLLDWNNTLSIFNGLIIWFQRPFGEYAISGLFSNPNYTGFWLATTWPLAHFLFLEKKFFNFKKVINLFLSCLIFFFTIMTNSRNALIGIISSILILFRKKLIYRIFILLIIIIFLITIANSILSLDFVSQIIDKIPSDNVIYKLTRFDLENFTNFPRIQLYNISLNNISKRILTGWGSGTFYIIYSLTGGEYNLNHNHNFFLELAYNYGLPVAIIVTSSVGYLFFNLLRKKSKPNLRTPINNAWFASCVASIIYQISDIPNYEGKISIIFWTLLAGLKCINEENQTST